MYNKITMKSTTLFISSIVIGVFLSINFTQAQTSGVSVDLLWEADTYTPSFYGGHSQISPESMVRVVALPVVNTGDSINQVKVNDFQFDWVKDGLKIGSYSGRGKNSLIYQANTSGSNVIKVTISTPAGIPVASSQLSLPVKQPKLVFYEEDPLAGPLSNQSLGKTFNLTAPEVTLRIEPFFFSTASVLKRRLNYNWTINDQKVVSNPDNQQLVTFATPEEGGSGTNIVNINVDSPDKLFQEAKSSLSITFNKSPIGF